MSSERRASSASSARRVSRRLRSRMSGCEREASAQTVGSEIFSSMVASSRRSRAESKILPQSAHFFADRGVGVFVVAKHMKLVYGTLAFEAECEGKCRDECAGVG